MVVKVYRINTLYTFYCDPHKAYQGDMFQDIQDIDFGQHGLVSLTWAM